jgi:hypothetical protein
MREVAGPGTFVVHQSLHTYMKKLVLFLTMICFLAGAPLSSWAQGGHYKGGKGSSHKGGKYKNKATNDHYRKRK